MHALNRVSRTTGSPVYTRWAAELAQAAHAAFTDTLPSGGRRMYWKMSVDLARPLVPAMGQHDPLDGFVTYRELQAAGEGIDLAPEIADMTRICRGGHLVTDDPLGIGGLLFDAGRIAQDPEGSGRMAQLLSQGGFACEDLLASVLDAALAGLAAFAGGGTLRYPAEFRLAFREFGLSIGLSGAGALAERVRGNPDLSRRAEALMRYTPLAGAIERFWMDGNNRKADTWTGNPEINMVMLATSLAPGEFLAV